MTHPPSTGIPATDHRRIHLFCRCEDLQQRDYWHLKINSAHTHRGPLFPFLYGKSVWKKEDEKDFSLLLCFFSLSLSACSFSVFSWFIKCTHDYGHVPLLMLVDFQAVTSACFKKRLPVRAQHSWKTEGSSRWREGGGGLAGWYTEAGLFPDDDKSRGSRTGLERVQRSERSWVAAQHSIFTRNRWRPAQVSPGQGRFRAWIEP